MTTRLTRDFFYQPTLTVAKELLGKRMIFRNFSGIITETEAYIGQDDKACHAAKGKTPRNAVMFGDAGFSYVYFIYGMYHCLNFVTEKENFPAAVLIRGLELPNINLIGPGKLCKHLGITKTDNKIDIINSDYFYLEETHFQPQFITTPRIGIKEATDKLWRFVIKD